MKIRSFCSRGKKIYINIKWKNSKKNPIVPEQYKGEEVKIFEQRRQKIEKQILDRFLIMQELLRSSIMTLTLRHIIIRSARRYMLSREWDGQ